jgi:hypothetical protein
MKRTLTLLVFALVGYAVKAQQNTLYVTVTGFAAAEAFFSNQNTGGMTVSFPFKLTGPSGSTVDSVFHSRTIVPFSALKVYILHLGAEVGNRRQFAGFHFSPMLMGEGETSNNLSFTVSYGRNLFFDLRPKRGATDRRFVLKPSLGVLFVSYKGVDNGSPTYLGSIDNKGNTIEFGGVTAGPTYTYSNGNRYDPQTYTDSVNSLNIYYAQREWSLQPKIAIGTNPYRRHFYVEVYAAYTLSFSEKGTVFFTQDDDHQVASRDLKDGNLTVIFNNARVKATPYRLNGWSVGFVMGLSFGRG